MWKIQRPFQLNWSPDGVLRISSDRDDQTGAKIKTPQNPLGFKQNPKKSLDQNLSPKKSHAEFPSHIKTARKNKGIYITHKKNSFEYLKKSPLIAKFVVSRCAFCKLQRNFGFFCSVNQSSGPLRKHIFTCDWCISIHFVCFCVSRFVGCDRPVSGNNRLVFFEHFPDHSYSCLDLLPSTRSPLFFASSFAILEQSRVILSFVFAGQARQVLCIVMSINSAPTQMIDGTEKPIRSL